MGSLSEDDMGALGGRSFDIEQRAIEETDADDRVIVIHCRPSRAAFAGDAIFGAFVEADDVRHDRQHDQDGGDDETAAADAAGHRLGEIESPVASPP
jgi:hypothetical protein